MNRKWTEKEIKEWYDSLPWLRGSNFLPSDCVNRLDMWQSFGREEHLKTADKELDLTKGRKGGRDNLSHVSIDSHLTAFAAEESWLTKKEVLIER